jgi:NAD(P)-dependent dehydrogenase (short-subunit alcohol dehydrogenase family)
MSPRLSINSSSVVLVSGGARGITAQCVIRLAARSHCKFILLGRSDYDENEPDWARDVVDEAELKRRIMGNLQASGEKPSPAKVQKVFKTIQSGREIGETLRSVREVGGQAEYLNVDITHRADLQERLPESVNRMGPVTGIIHGAGTLADKLIEKKSEKDFDTVYSPKVNGLENMLACVPARQLDFLVLFSSIVGFFGNIGQADYAIANETLNKTAYLIKRQNPACHVVSMNWGPWDAGMVTPELKKVFSERNIDVIPVDIGANMLVDELVYGDQDTVQVIIGNAPVNLTANNLDLGLQSYQIKRTLSLDGNPFLFDHVIGDHPVLPATCAAVWIASSCEQLYPGYQFLSLERLRVLKGIVFNDSLASEHVLDLKETSKTPGGEVEFDALIWSKNKQGKTLYHYSMHVTLVREFPPAPIQKEVPSIVPGFEDQVIQGDDLYKNGTLFHGPSFQGVDKVLHVSPGKLIMRCILPKLDESQQGQFPVQTCNPFIYDAIVQCLLIWAQYLYGAPCLPSRMEKLEQYKAIPFEQPCLVSMEVTSQSETSVVADITVLDEQGQTYVNITSLEGTISKQLKRLFGGQK